MQRTGYTSVFIGCCVLASIQVGCASRSVPESGECALVAEYLGKVPRSTGVFDSKDACAAYTASARLSLQGLWDCGEARRVANAIVQCHESGWLNHVVEAHGMHSFKYVVEYCYVCARTEQDWHLCADLISADIAMGGDVSWPSYNLVYQERRGANNVGNVFAILDALSERDPRTFERVAAVIFADCNAPVAAFERAKAAGNAEIAADTIDNVALGFAELIGTEPLVRIGDK